MGRDSSVMSSITYLKNIEIDRLKVSAKNIVASNRSSSPKINLDEEEKDLLNAQLNQICGNFNESVHEEGFDHICSDLVATPREQKSNSRKKNKTSSTLKKPITPSKLSFK